MNFCDKAKYVAMSTSTDINNIQIAPSIYSKTGLRSGPDSKYAPQKIDVLRISRLYRLYSKIVYTAGFTACTCVCRGIAPTTDVTHLDTVRYSIAEGYFSTYV